jgi:predicted nuclease of restriction endonuclease-like (RecB) superfamily
MKNSSVKKSETTHGSLKGYDSVLSGLVDLLESARRTSSRTINAIMTATYWEIGRRIVEFEQGGDIRAEYKAGLLERLSRDLTSRFGRGFSVDNLETMRLFYKAYPPERISETLSRKSDALLSSTSKSETPSRKFNLSDLSGAFPLSWSHYVQLLRRSRSAEARAFYETEALRCGWSVRQLDRQISSLFYERILLSKNKTAMLKKGAPSRPEDMVTPDEEIKDPYILEFLNLKDEYSENDLEQALIQQLEKFLLELGGDFAFIGRQRRLRIGDDWYRVDLLFFHRRLQCLVVIDLKVGKFTHADAGQMHLYLNYAREHWTNEGENPPVGLILCAEKNAAVAHYALEGLPNKVMAAEYKMKLPDEKMLAAELKRSRKLLESRIFVSAKKESRQ